MFATRPVSLITTANLNSYVEEFFNSQVEDTEGFQHGYVVAYHSYESDPWDQFYLTLAEAKVKFSHEDLYHDGDSIAIYEGEYRPAVWCDDSNEVRGPEVKIAERKATEKEVLWHLAEKEAWEEACARNSQAYWHMIDWLSGRTPAPEWGQLPA